MTPEQISLRLVNHIPAMIAYWDCDQRCVFANDAYLTWFGRDRREMQGISLMKLLGRIYEKNLPYILGALRGERQVFERQLTLPSGETREAIATYTPDILNGVVRGFSAHVADVTLLRDRERLLEQTMRERDEARKESEAMRKFTPICSGCKSIRDKENRWRNLEEFMEVNADFSFSHGVCPACLAKY